jgi:hypothetical protein
MELSENTNMPVQIIVASKRVEDIEFCQKIATRTGFAFTPLSDFSLLDSLLIKNPESLLFLDLDLPIANALPIIAKHLKTRHVFGLANETVFDLPEASRVSAIGHFCVRHYNEFAENWIAKLCTPLFSADPFGLHYYKDETSKTQTIELKAAREKTAAIDAIGNLLARRKMNDRAIQMILRALDEVLMNAIFDAPIDTKGRRYRRETDRNEDFELRGKERVFLNLALNENFVNLSVKDQFGSFLSERAFDAVRRDYSQAAYQLDGKTKSAGLGLHGIAASGLSFMISCKLNLATESVISFPYYQNFKETKNAFRSFSFNVKE